MDSGLRSEKDHVDWCEICERIVPDGVNGRPSKHDGEKHGVNPEMQAARDAYQRRISDEEQI